MHKGTVYLIPSVISPDTQDQVIPEQVNEVIRSTNYFIAETVRESRRFISSLKLGIDISTLHFEKVDKDTSDQEAEKYLKPALEGHDIGVLSDAGCPGVADPGALVTKLAHKLGLRVVPLVGPSSLLLALMASGLNGQSFTFHGYLPIDQKEVSHTLSSLEKSSRANNQTQLFIETPYRSDRTLEVLLKTLHPETLLCVATDITGKNESVQTKQVALWQKQKRVIGKAPTVFLFLAQ